MSRRHPTIALFAAPLDAALYFQKWQIWSGAAHTARVRGANLLYVAGGEAHRDPRAVLYDLVDAEAVQGIVSWNGVVTPWQVDQVSAFLERFQPLPVVNIGFHAPGIPSLTFDQCAGVSAAVAHLTEIHGLRRIVFLASAAPHPGMAAGLAGYRDELRRQGCLDGELEVEAQPGAALAALDARGLRPGLDYQAVVCPLDSLAMQVIEELQARGVHVPGEVAVTGLHDGQEARLTTPSLTTLRLPWEESGALAVERALNLLSGQTVPEQTVLPLQLVVRRSCGCLDARTSAAAAGRAAAVQSRAVSSRTRTGRPDRAAPWQASAVRRDVVAALEAAAGRAAANAAPEWAGLLFDSFAADLEDRHEQGSAPTPPRTMLVLENLLRLTAAGSGSVAAWHDVVSAMRQTLLPHFDDGRDGERTAAEDLWQQARFAVGQAITRQEARRAWQTMQRAQVVQELEAALHVAPGVAEVIEIFTRSLPRLGIERCNVALFDDPDRPAAGAHVVLAYEDGHAALLPEGGQAAASSVLWHAIHPARSDRAAAPNHGVEPNGSAPASAQGQPVSSLVEALFFGDEPLGVVSFGADPADGPGKATVYEALRSQLSSALMGARRRAETEAARRQAVEANQLKSRFLSMVSHELRTPLAQIVGVTEMANLRAARRSTRDADLAEILLGYHHQIHASAQHLDRLIRDVLDLASDHVGQLRLEREPLDMLDLLTHTAAVGQQMAAEKGLGWRCELPAALPVVMGDRTRLQQVLLNLLANAAKFTAHGEMGLRAQVREQRLVVEVFDTGPGVPVSEQQAIFNEFYRAPGSGTCGTQGLGLGLAVSRLLIEQHGGTIGVRSTGKAGEGSTFHFSLQVLKDAAVAGQPAAPERPATGPVVILSSASSTSDLLCRRLEMEGFEIACLPLRTGEDPVPAVLALKPGAVLLECATDAESGWQVIRGIKEQPAGRAIPVIFYSLVEQEDRGGLLTLDILAKPAGAVELTEALARHGIRPASGQRTHTILVIDDDPETLTIHAQLLRTQLPGSRVLTAPGGRAALEALRIETPGLVILDLLMPEMDGFELLEILRADPRTRHMPVVVLTGRALTEADMSRLANGATTVLSKGVFTVQETLARIQAVLTHVPQLGTDGQRQVRRAMAYIHGHYAEPVTRRDIAAYLGLHEDSLSHYFTQEVGISIISYLNRYRVKQASQLLEASHKSITEIALEVGFGSHSYFNRVFAAEMGVTPTAYRKMSRS
jgi:signal transduction histidine kinase/DNA-binding LacI/PurR family transcriptional regulator/DNA-binding response OmpR family regulator